MFAAEICSLKKVEIAANKNKKFKYFLKSFFKKFVEFKNSMR